MKVDASKTLIQFGQNSDHRQKTIFGRKYCSQSF